MFFKKRKTKYVKAPEFKLTIVPGTDMNNYDRCQLKRKGHATSQPQGAKTFMNKHSIRWFKGKKARAGAMHATALKEFKYT